MTRASSRVLISIFLLGVGVAASTALPLASARVPDAKHVTCDDPSSPEYEILAIAPRRCFLGLQESPYQVQRLRGHRNPPPILIRRLHWRHWGHHRATARGLGCLAYERSCAPARIEIWKPVRVLPAGSLYIYQRIKVHVRHKGNWPAVTAWYQPGLDY